MDLVDHLGDIQAEDAQVEDVQVEDFRVEAPVEVEDIPVEVAVEDFRVEVSVEVEDIQMKEVVGEENQVVPIAVVDNAVGIVLLVLEETEDVLLKSQPFKNQIFHLTFLNLNLHCSH